MEPSKEPISVRVAQLNSQIVSTKVVENKSNLISRESLLDALTVLYDECNSDCLKKYDRQISTFVEKQRTVLNEVKRLRVNVSDFEVKTVIGRGHFGEVYVVKEKQTGDVYAMKTVKKSQCTSDKGTSFEEERDIMANAGSPWLTSLQYAFQDGNYLYFIMEYHPGGDLLGLLHRQGGTIPESAASFYIAELVLALNDLHNMGYVHRDVKPDNILLDRCGHIKLADFGSSARLKDKKLVSEGIPVGTPDYIAPEVLQSMDNKNSKRSGYGVSCDYWSVGILAYMLTVGNSPFSESSTVNTYSKIMNYKTNLKFPPDITLTQAYVSLVKGLLTEPNLRLNYEQILKHSLFKSINFNDLRNQVPPYVPKIDSVDDTSNFCDVPAKKNEPNIDNFKTKTQFSGKHLPFIGFTYTHDLYEYKRRFPSHSHEVKNERVEELQKEVNKLQRQLIKSQESVREKENIERKFEDKTRKLENLESLRNHLERDLANSIAECNALKRTLELERKDRTDLEHKAIELIKSAKLKWETSEKIKVDTLNLELAQQKEKIEQLTTTNALLNEQLQHALQLEQKHKTSLESVQQYNRQSIVGLESRLEQVTSDTQNKVLELQNKLAEESHQKTLLQNQVTTFQYSQASLKEKLKISEQTCNGYSSKLEANQKLIRELENKIVTFEESAKAAEAHKVKTRALQEEIAKLESDQKIEELERKLKNVKEAYALLPQQVQNLKEEINISTALRESAVQEQKDRNAKQLEELQERLSKVSEEKNSLELQLQEAKANDATNKLKVQALEDLLKRLENGVLKLETDSDRENVLKEQIERLEQQLIQVHENAAVEKEELNQLKTKFWRVEKDLGNAEIDKRIFKRELKEAEGQNKQLATEVENLKEKMAENTKIHESSLLELSNLNDDLANEIVKLKELVKHMESKLEDEREKYDDNKSTVNQLRSEIAAKDSTIASLLKDMEISKHEKLELERKIEILENEKLSILQLKENSVKEKNLVNNKLDNCKRELQNTQLNLNALREACTMLENQLIEYEQIHASYETKQQSSNQNTERLIGELAQAKEEVQQARKQVNEERSLKLMAETKCKRLQEDIECIQKECLSYKQQCIDFRQYSSNLTDELTVAEEKATDYEVTLKSYERQISDLIIENKILKEESSAQLTHLSSVKQSNYQLGQQLEEFKRDNQALVEALNELQDTLTQKSNFYKERELKTDSTIQQQIKLIDFLQSKVEEKKKKTLTDMLFGHKKENLPPSGVALNYKDLENLLYKERDLNKDLRQEVAKLKAELGHKTGKTFQEADKYKVAAPVSPRTKLTLEKLAQSPNTAKSDLFRQNSTQRMSHKIPHRFESKLCTKTSKCTHCSHQIILGRNMKYCTECHLAAHPNCAKYLPKTCGVPKALVKHYSENMSKLNGNSAASKEATENTPENVNIEGWIKIPVRGNTGWERHYACLTPTTLKIYAEPPNNKNISPIKTLELKQPGSHGTVILEPVASEIGTPVAVSDMPFIIKVEVSTNSTCWPPENVILMTLSIPDKEKWFKALQAVVDKNEGKYTGKIVLQYKDLDVNCIVDLTGNTKLLGTEQGLYSCRDGNLLRIAGPINVHQIAILHNVRLAVMIVDDNRFLVTCDLNHLIDLTQCAPCSKPTLIFKAVNVNNLQGFHIFEVSDFVKTFMLALATARQLIIMIYDHKLYDFIPVRVLDTAEPTSCIAFTEHSLIVGANKFFEIDLISFEADEFLDESDKKLCQAVMCYTVGSFPLAIMQISKKPIEYLLCFHEFAIFTDEFGRCSRVTDIKWSRLPRAFYYYAPYLYIVQFSSIEIIKITPDTCNLLKSSVDSLLNVDTFTVNVSNPYYLGHSKKGIYVSSNGEVRYIEGKEIDVDSLSISSTSTEQSENKESNEEGSEFSFTSSMVQSLDGHLSDFEADDLGHDGVFTHKEKKVTFGSHS